MFIKRKIFLPRIHIKKKMLVDLVNCLGYLGGVDPSTEVDKICLKHLIDVSLLMGGSLS